MPRRTGLPTLTDERRKWDAKRLYLHYSRSKPQPAVKSWRQAFPDSTANDNSSRVMWGQRVRWFQENFPEEFDEFAWSLCPDWMLRSSGVKRPPRAGACPAGARNARNDSSREPAESSSPIA